MRWVIAAVGSPKLAFAKAGVEEYTSRLVRFTKIEQVTIRADASSSRESDVLLAKTDRAFRIAMDPRGRAMTSEDWAALVADHEMRGTGTLAILIGGAEGHSSALLEKSDLRVSLGPITMQHELAQVVVLEQIYRAYTILRGLPYHRA